MKTTILLISLVLSPLIVSAQWTATFEDIPLPVQGYLNNAPDYKGFVSGPCFLPNTYFSDFQYWEGWAISRITDNKTPGFQNQYSAIAGSGAANTDQYAVSYAPDGTVIHMVNGAATAPLEGMWITNNTYAYYAMKNGDAFSKQFGGLSGNDPDFFSLTIRGTKDGIVSPDSVVFYLADYRFSDNNKDYIVNDWVWIDLSAIGPVDSLLFTLNSSDVGQFGMNTPAYFCMDQLTLSDPNALVHAAEILIPWQIAPNPASNEFRLLNNFDETNLYLLNTAGTVVRYWQNILPDTPLNISDVPSGNYWLKGDKAQSVKMVIQH